MSMATLLHNLTTTWWGISLISIAAAVLLAVLSVVFYKQFFKRFYDILLSGMAIVVLSPVIVILVVLGAIKMKGNPFFTQLRPGKNEKIFRLIKFRTMTCEKDADGNLLPDEDRLTQYGKLLRSTSLDELPELFNIFVGHMSIVGPRPLLVEYLPYYTDVERARHSVRPGLTGWAQVNGRNSVEWDRRIQFDVEYVTKLSLFGDIKILLLTVVKVISRSDISENTNDTEGNFAEIRRNKMESANKQESKL